MTAHDDPKQSSGCAEPEARLRTAHAEMLRPILTVQGVAAILKELDAEIVKGLPKEVGPDEFEQLIRWLEAAGADLERLRDRLTAPGDGV